MPQCSLRPGAARLAVGGVGEREKLDVSQIYRAVLTVCLAQPDVPHHTPTVLLDRYSIRAAA